MTLDQESLRDKVIKAMESAYHEKMQKLLSNDDGEADFRDFQLKAITAAFDAQHGIVCVAGTLDESVLTRNSTP